MLNTSQTKSSIFTFIDFSFTKIGGKLSSTDPYLIFIRELHGKFKRSCLAARVDINGSKGSYEWPENLDTFPLLHGNTFKLFSSGVAGLPKFEKSLKDAAAPFNQLLLCWPHPISYMLARRYAKSKKIFLLVRQNQVAITKSKYTGWKRGFGLIGLRFLEHKLKGLKEYVQIITVGDEMNKHYGQNGFSSVLMGDSLISIKSKGKPKTSINSPLQLLFVGRIEKEKGLDILLKTCCLIREKHPNFHLQVLGDGSQSDAMKLMAVNAGLDSHVTFLGHVTYGEDLFRFFKNADLLIIPSRTEGFPKIIHEARAFGLPIVAMPVGGMTMELQQGNNIWFAERADEKALAVAILKMIDNPEVYTFISNNLLQEFEANTIERAIKNYSVLLLKEINT